MSKIYEDGNALGRAAALILLALAVFGLHRLSCGGAMCPAIKTDSCCAAEHAENRSTSAGGGEKAAQVLGR